MMEGSNYTYKVYELKLQNLSEANIRILNRMFLEAKWFYNYIVADLDSRLHNGIWKVNKVEIMTPNGIEEREITLLGSQIKQGIVNRVWNGLKTLSILKKKGEKVGALKFKSDFSSIPLPQYGNTFRIDTSNNKISFQKIKKKFRILGLKQIPDNAKIANANLIKKPSGYYVHVTCKIPVDVQDSNNTHPVINKPIGLDFGIGHQIFTSSGFSICWSIPESKRLKKLQRMLSRKVKGSNNYIKTLYKIQREWERIKNRRKDIQNKIIALLKRYNKVIIQDENIRGWKSGLFGKQIQSTGIGGITSRLKNNLETTILVDRFIPTTKTCSNCGHIQQMKLSDRIFKCENCKLLIDRDWNAAINILKLGLKEETTSLKNLPLGWREVTPVEKETAVRILGSNSNIRISFLDEAGSHKAGSQ